MDNTFLTHWGLSLMVFLPLAGALLMMVIPKTEELTQKVVALGAALGSAVVGLWIMFDFNYDHADKLQYVVNKPWIEVISPASSSASTACRSRWSR